MNDISDSCFTSFPLRSRLGQPLWVAEDGGGLLGQLMQLAGGDGGGHRASKLGTGLGQGSVQSVGQCRCAAAGYPLRIAVQDTTVVMDSVRVSKPPAAWPMP